MDANFIKALLEAQDLVRRQATGPWKKLLLANFADWAAKGYLFGAVYRNKIAAVGVAGPVTAAVLNEKGAGIMPADYDAEGRRLYCAYSLVDKRLRGRVGRQLMTEMLRTAMRQFPQTGSLVYARALRNDVRLRERAFKRAILTPQSAE